MSEPTSPQGAEQPTVLGASPEREWLTYAEAGHVVGLSRVTLWKLVSAGVSITYSLLRSYSADL